jgi:hypothetical protein
VQPEQTQTPLAPQLQDVHLIICECALNAASAIPKPKMAVTIFLLIFTISLLIICLDADNGRMTILVRSLPSGRDAAGTNANSGPARAGFTFHDRRMRAQCRQRQTETKNGGNNCFLNIHCIPLHHCWC